MIGELKVGDEVMIDGSLFKVTKIDHGIPHLQEVQVKVTLT
jgi:hypothetical protein